MARLEKERSQSVDRIPLSFDRIDAQIQLTSGFGGCAVGDAVGVACSEVALR